VAAFRHRLRYWGAVDVAASNWEAAAVIVDWPASGQFGLEQVQGFHLESFFGEQALSHRDEQRKVGQEQPWVRTRR
jgi:hypothetical protein